MGRDRALATEKVGLRPSVRRETRARVQLGPTGLRGVGSSARACAAVPMGRGEGKRSRRKELRLLKGAVCHARDLYGLVSTVGECGAADGMEERAVLGRVGGYGAS